MIGGRAREGVRVWSRLSPGRSDCSLTLVVRPEHRPSHLAVRAGLPASRFVWPWTRCLVFSVPQCSYLLMGTGILGAAARFERVQPPRAEEGAWGTAAGPAEVRKRPLIMFSVLGRAVRPVVPVPPFLSSLRTLHPHTEKVPDPNQIFPLENSRTPSDGTRSPPGRPAVVRATSPRAPRPPAAPSLLFQPYDRLSASEPAEPSSALGCSRSHPLGGEPCHGVLLLLNVPLSWGWDRGNLPVTRRPPRRI